MREINKIIVHCSFTSANQPFTASDIRRWHIDDNGWSDIGYHDVILRDGIIESGRPCDHSGAHARGHNHDSIGVCLVGGKGYNGSSEFNFTFNQILSLRTYIKSKMSEFPNAEVVGHNQVSSKDCPCFDVNSMIQGMI